MYIQPVRVTQKNAHRLFQTLLPLNRIFAREAVALGTTVEIFSGANMFRFRDGRTWHYIRNVDPGLNSHCASLIAKDKILTNALLHEANIPVPHGISVSREEFSMSSWRLPRMRFPLVVKPARGTSQGKGVITNIRTQQDLKKILQQSFRHYDEVIIEEFYINIRHYRVLVLDNKVIAAVERISPFVIGDGQRSIRQLIRAKNAERKKETRMKLGLITMDEELHQTLRSQDLSLTTRLPKGRHVFVKNICNLANGGETRDVTSLLCSENRRLSLAAVRAIGLRYGGVDLMCPDIRKPLTKHNGAINEVNCHPCIGLHHFPNDGTSRHVASPILRAVLS